MRLILASLAAAVLVSAAAQPSKSGTVLGDLTWQEAEAALTPSAVVVIPLGAASVQGGPQLRLDNDERLARYLAQRLRAAADVVIAPSLSYHFYPAFVEYPGSTSLSQNTARDVTAEIVRSLAKHGPRRFYVLNTGAATLVPLKNAADALADQGILLGYTDMRYRLVNARVARQQAPTRGPSHADEIETSMMLFVDPSRVDMRKAVREYGTGTGAFTRVKDGPGIYSASGVLGDPTLATREKGQGFVDAVVAAALEDIEAIRTAPLPAIKATAPPPPPPPPPATRPPVQRPDPQQPNGCQPSDERAIRAVGEKFTTYWQQMDPDRIAELFTVDGDMRHPDGTIERGPVVIRNNRRDLFRQREFRGSAHPVSLTDIRCIGSAAIADGKWELRIEDTARTGAPARNLGSGPRHQGWCTLVLLRGGEGTWSIQAWRYTVDPTNGTPPPTTLKQPGFIGRGGG
jgi:creatinine amidohydrolase